MITLALLALLLTKHFIVDFPLQTPYQYLNKGTYGHPGGILHAVLHGAGTFMVIAFTLFNPVLALTVGLVDAVIHYHIDWAKMKINSIMEWKVDKHEQFWWLLGLDQYLHALTYIAIVGIIIL